MATLATGLPATALTGLDLHQLGTIERFHSLMPDPPLPRFSQRDRLKFLDREDKNRRILNEIAESRVRGSAYTSMVPRRSSAPMRCSERLVRIT